MIFDDLDSMYTFIGQLAAERHLIQTAAALPFAAKKHQGQMRKGKLSQKPYIIHPLTMACHAVSLGIEDDTVLSVCLLHDVCEDCGVVPEELPVGKDAQQAVALLTREKDKRISKDEAGKIYYSRMRNNRTACLVKLFDRCNNLSEMTAAFSESKLREYIDETRAYILPVAEMLCASETAYEKPLFALQYQICSLIHSVEDLLDDKDEFGDKLQKCRSYNR